MEAVLILLLVAGAWFWEATPTDEATPAPTRNPVEVPATPDASAQSSQAVGCRLTDQAARYRDLTRPWAADRAVDESRPLVTPQ